MSSIYFLKFWIITVFLLACKFFSPNRIRIQVCTMLGPDPNWCWSASECVEQPVPTYHSGGEHNGDGIVENALTKDQHVQHGFHVQRWISEKDREQNLIGWVQIWTHHNQRIFNDWGREGGVEEGQKALCGSSLLLQVLRIRLQIRRIRINLTVLIDDQFFYYVGSGSE